MTNKEMIQTWFANIDANNFEGVKNLMDSRHKFHNPMTAAPVGINEHIGMMQMMTTAFKGQHHLDLVITEGNHLVVKGYWTGKHAGTFNGIPASDKTVTFTWIDIFEIVNGKVVTEYFEMNPMSIMQQISAVPSNA
jgi:predicted ester cyclase